ncbi:hypothetical protein FRC02_005120 [Tulasnella sp. 418]|nr:hypothetical protein FRC02_005120 [Tulasnella sp. 418]
MIFRLSSHVAKGLPNLGVRSSSTRLLSTNVSSRLISGPSQYLRSPRVKLETNQRFSSTLTNILDDVPAPPIQVRRMTEDGIELMDGLLLPSSCIFLNGRVFLWEVPDMIKDGRWNEWNKDMFEIFDVIIPKPEILLLGTGPKAVLPPPDLRKHLASIGIQVDVMDTWNACSTYNLLTEEGRRVAAALMQPSRASWKL